MLSQVIPVSKQHSGRAAPKLHGQRKHGFPISFFLLHLQQTSKNLLQTVRGLPQQIFGVEKGVAVERGNFPSFHKCKCLLLTRGLFSIPGLAIYLLSVCLHPILGLGDMEGRAAKHSPKEKETIGIWTEDLEEYRAMMKAHQET